MKKHDSAVTLVLPEHKKGKESMIFGTLGQLFRCVLAFVWAFGTLRFFCDSMRMPVGGGYVFLVTFLLCAIFSVMAFSKTALAVGGVLMACGGVFYFSVGGHPFETLYAVLMAVSSAWYSRLCELGYRYDLAVADVSDLAETVGRSEWELYFAGMCLAAVLICAVAVAFTVRRARLFPMLALVTVMCTVILYFGAGDNLFSFGLVIASLLALAALSYYDSVFTNKRNVMTVLETDSRSPGAKKELAKTLREGAGYGGYVGIAVLAVSFVVLLPTMRIDRAMTDIPAVSEPALRVEKYISALVNGYAPGGDGLFSIFGDELDGHGTKAKPRSPSGKVLFTVGSDTVAPIYLRTWTGIDYMNDRWHTVSYARRDSYRDMFGEDFSSDTLFYEMRTAVDPSLAQTPEAGEAITNIPLGYITTRVSIKKEAASDSEVILPTGTRHGDGVMKYGTSEPHFIDYGNYHDGVYTSSTFGLSDSYTVYADITTTPDSTLAYNISAFVKHYSEQYSVIKEVRGMLEAGADEDEVRVYYEGLEGTSSVVTDAYESLDGAYYFPDREMTLAYRYVYSMSQAEREEINALCDRLSAYNDYVYANYVTLCENHGSLSELMAEIAEANSMSFRREAATYAGRHRSVIAVTDYLSENMTYTLSPKAPDGERQYYNAADTFLFDTKEGYCVQYATAAAMLLRCVGVPARYVEGYIADDFRPSSDTDISSYIAKVTELKRHAWIEVYYDYYGWVRYEVTTPYIGSASRDGSYVDIRETTDGLLTDTLAEDTADTEISDTMPSDPSVEPNITDAEGKGGIILAVILTIAILTAIIASVCVVTLALRARYTRFYNEMRELHKIAASRDTSRDQRLDAARKMGDIITKLLKYHSLTPDTGETASRFACRCDKQIQPLVGVSIEKAMKAMQASEFSDDISRDELLCISEYLDRLYRAAVSKVGRLDAVKLKYFKLVS